MNGREPKIDPCGTHHGRVIQNDTTLSKKLELVQPLLQRNMTSSGKEVWKQIPKMQGKISGGLPRNALFLLFSSECETK